MQIDNETLAITLYRAVRNAVHAFTGTLDKDWDEAQDSHKTMFLIVALRGPDVIEYSEGQPIAGIAARLYALAHCEPTTSLEYWQNSTDRITCLVWEVVARYLAMIVDSDELNDLGQAEQFWFDWAKRKRESYEQAENRADRVVVSAG